MSSLVAATGAPQDARPSTDDAFLFPTPQHLKAAEETLLSLGYPAYNRRLILADLARAGTAQCSKHLWDGDRDAIEATLPGVNAWQRPADADAYVWTTTDPSLGDL
jgi:hypothetical protein